MNIIILHSTVKQLKHLQVPLNEIQVGNEFSHNDVKFVITYVTTRSNTIDFGCAHITNTATIINN